MSNLEISALAALFLLIFVANIPSGESITCYVCNSRNDSQCANKELPDSFKSECISNYDGKQYTMCRKIVQFIDFDVNGNPSQSRVIRGCGWYSGQYEGRCYHRSGMGGRQVVCSCKEDGCNTATPIGSSHVSLLLFAAASVVFGSF